MLRAAQSSVIKSLVEYDTADTGDWFADASELCRTALETDRNEVSSRPACSVGAHGCHRELESSPLS